MAVANGYGKVVTSGSVFMYDTGDFYNSYKGQPGTNITTGVGRNYNGYNLTTYSPGVFFESNGYTEVVNIPALGPTTVQSVEINNSAPGYQCCPNLYNYTGGWMSPIWTGGQTYSYQIIYKCRSGYTHPNFMYHYEYTAGESYLTEYGVFTTDKQESLGDGWYHAWNTFTTNASAAKGYTGLWYYQYYVADKISIAAVSITPGDTIRPPQQIIPSGTTRSATQGLLPIVGNSTLNLSNISFTSNAQITFDGTDDYINSGNIQPFTLSNRTATWETVVKFGTSSGANALATKWSNSVGQIWWFGRYPSTKIHIAMMIGGGYYAYYSDGDVSSTTNYYHIVVTLNGTLLSYYINGVLDSTDTVAAGTWVSDNGQPDLIIGAQNEGTAANFNGEIPIIKFYDRVLTAAEVKQNYNKYKTRFNLP